MQNFVTITTFIFTFINLNKYDLNINWETDTKDEGGHLNYFGALKASEVLGNILKDTNLLVDHRGDKNYKLWDTAYLRYKEEIEQSQYFDLWILREAAFINRSYHDEDLLVETNNVV